MIQGRSVLVYWHYSLHLPADLHVLLGWLRSGVSMVPKSNLHHRHIDLDVRLGRVHQIP